MLSWGFCIQYSAQYSLQGIVLCPTYNFCRNNGLLLERNESCSNDSPKSGKWALIQAEQTGDSKGQNIPFFDDSSVD